MSKGTKQKVTEAQKRATAKYNAKAYERIELRVIKGRKEIISKVAEANNESTNALINRAIDRELERLGVNPSTISEEGVNAAQYILEVFDKKD